MTRQYQRKLSRRTFGKAAATSWLALAAGKARAGDGDTRRLNGAGAPAKGWFGQSRRDDRSCRIERTTFSSNGHDPLESNFDDRFGTTPLSENVYGRVAVETCLDGRPLRIYEPVYVDASKSKDKLSSFYPLPVAEGARHGTWSTHGYNNAGAYAIKRFSSLKRHIELSGNLHVHVWPSHGWEGAIWEKLTALLYQWDASNLEQSVEAIRESLVEFLKTHLTVDAITSSMGARGFVLAVDLIYKSQDKALLARLRNVLLATPDQRVPEFEQRYLPAARAFQFHTTILVSKQDLAMKGSEWWNGDRRVGSTSKGIYVSRHPRIQTVDISDVDDSTNGHAGMFEARAVQTAIREWLVEQKPIGRRYKHSEHRHPNGRYWRLER